MRIGDGILDQFAYGRLSAHSFFVTGVTPVTSHLSWGSARVAYFVTGVAVTGVIQLEVQNFAFWHLCHGGTGQDFHREPSLYNLLFISVSI